MPEDQAGAGRDRTELEGSVSALYEEAKRTIAQWCRDADESARRIIENAETARRVAHAEAERVREAARLEAGRILAEAEAKAGELRAGSRLAGAGHSQQIDLLQQRVDTLASSIDYLLDSLDGVLQAVAALAPGRHETPAVRQLGSGTGSGEVSKTATGE